VAALLFPVGSGLIALAIALAVDFRGTASWVTDYNLQNAPRESFVFGKPWSFASHLLAVRTFGALVTGIIGVGFLVAAVISL
jgi:hypothetical protein